MPTSVYEIVQSFERRAHRKPTAWPKPFSSLPGSTIPLLIVKAHYTPYYSQTNKNPCVEVTADDMMMKTSVRPSSNHACDHNHHTAERKKTNSQGPASSNQKTKTQFRSRAGKSGGTTSHQLRSFAEATLGGGSLRKVVKLPEGEDENEWLAVNMVDFYNQINLLYGAITEFCSPQSCPEMRATEEYEYLWQDSENYKRPTKMAAPAYIEQLMAWVQSNIDNEQVLPSRIGVPFPKSFPSLVRQIFKRMYRVYAHIYCHHYPVVRELGLEPHLNTSFKQYVLFIDEHSLASGKDYWGPLGDLVDSMLKSD